MMHYVAIVDTVEAAMANSREALVVWADILAGDGRTMPSARTVTNLRHDPETAGSLKDYMIALIPFEPALSATAEEITS